MQEMTMGEVDEVSGGNPLVPLVVGVGAVVFYAVVAYLILSNRNT